MRLVLLLVVSLHALVANATFNPPTSYLVDYKLRYTYTVDSLNRFWKKNGMPKIVLPVRNDVDMYEVTYKGMWLDSSFITAKGVLYVPKSTKPMSEMVYCHGTRISIEQGYGIDDLEQVVCMMHAADGYIAMFPFYYGLGGSEKEHVYQDSPTEALSVAYMIRACREIYPKLNVPTANKLFITGYSQGGHAAMATHRLLESGGFDDISLTASSPMSGAYDMTGVQAQTMFTHYDRPHYLPYLILSYQYAYNIWKGDVYEVFKEPYKSMIKEMFAQPRQVDYGRMDEILPKVPKDMVVDTLIDLFKNDPNFPFTCKLRDNCLWNWVPKAPLQLCACYGDNEVMYQNTEVAYNYMIQHSNRVYKRVFGKHLSHNPCAPFAILYSKFFFDNMRKEKAKPEKLKAGQKIILSLGIGMAEKQAKKKLKQTGKVEEDALASRRKKG